MQRMVKHGHVQNVMFTSSKELNIIYMKRPKLLTILLILGDHPRSRALSYP